MVCIAGLAGTTHVTYINNVVKELGREFKCVFVQWRGSSGVPITTSKLYCMDVWTDIKEAINHI